MLERPLSTDTIRRYRQSLLGFASDFTIRRGDPHAVLANATALEKWLDATDSANDKRNRFEALHRAALNRSDRRIPDDKPELLIAEAETYYAFLKAA